MAIFEGVPDILDVTARDGSYLIDFQFTAEDTAKIASALEAVGLRWIEVGHGIGLHASEAGKGQAAATDEEYLEATANALKKAKWGMFCIPGIARLEDLDLAARYHMPFVRIGTNITELEQGQPFIERAKELGFIVSYNAMKSYAVTPSEFGKYAALAASYGADIVCLVDSAGGMFPDDISAYLDAAKGECDAHLGFHGHDNLAMAMANTLRAVEHGASLIDSSLRGMGRSAGNTVTEALVAILKQRGYLSGINLNGVMDVGQGLIAPLMHGHGLDPMAVTAGYARFHSSFTNKVKQYAEKYDLDVRDLIVRLTQEDMVSAPDDLLERIGKELAEAKIPRVASRPVYGVSRERSTKGASPLRTLLKAIRPKAVKEQKFSVLNIVTGEAPMEEMSVSANVHDSAAHVVGSLVLTKEEHLIEALKVADGNVDIVFLDVDRKPFATSNPGGFAKERLEKSRLLTYFDSRIWVDAVEDQVLRMLGEDIGGEAIVLVGDHPKSRFLALRFAERFAKVALFADDASDDARRAFEAFSFDPSHLTSTYLPAGSPERDAWIENARLVVAWTAPGRFGVPLAAHLKRDAFVLDAGVGSLDADALAEAHRRGALLVRVNIWPALTGALEAAHESARVWESSFGWRELNGVPIAAGGAIGKAGDVVVDSVKFPTRVIGVADGRGGVIYEYGPDDEARVNRVNDEINRRQIAPRA